MKLNTKEKKYLQKIAGKIIEFHNPLWAFMAGSPEKSFYNKELGDLNTKIMLKLFYNDYLHEVGYGQGDERLLCTDKNIWKKIKGVYPSKDFYLFEHEKPDEAWLFVGGERIYGKDITAHHKTYQTWSHHCVCCGAPYHVREVDYNECWNCGAGKEERNNFTDRNKKNKHE